MVHIHYYSLSKSPRLHQAGSLFVSIVSRSLLNGKNEFATVVFGFEGKLDPNEIVKPGNFSKFYQEFIGRSDLIVEDPTVLGFHRYVQ